MKEKTLREHLIGAGKASAEAQRKKYGGEEGYKAEMKRRRMIGVEKKNNKE